MPDEGDPAADVIFKHEPLDGTRKQLRLLRLTGSGDEVNVTVRHADLDDDNGVRPHYCALSYTWGNPERLYKIHVNGHRFMIRKNLFMFLVVARDKGFDKDLWIDQLSIDQGNLTERNHQVGSMAEIYANAAEVIVWLGVEALEDERYESTLKDIKEFFEIPRLLDLATGKGVRTIAHPAHGVVFDYLRSSIGKDLAEFFSNAYWHRLWIIQELAMAKSIVVWAGRFRAGWECVADLRHLFGKESILRKVTSENPKPVWQEGESKSPTLEGLPGGIEYLLEIATSGKRHASLFHAMERFSRSGCEDPRDKVYGLLAIMDTGGTIEIDYHKSTWEVFFDVVTVICSEIKPCDTEYYDVFVRLHFICNELVAGMIRGTADHVRESLWDNMCNACCRGENQRKFHLAVRSGQHIGHVINILRTFFKQ